MILKPRLFRRPNFSHPLARGLVGCWLMNEGGGNIIWDSSRNVNTGSLVADARFVAGIHGPVVYCDGTGDCITVPANAAFTVSPNITVVAWFSTVDTTYRGIISAEDFGVDYNWRMYLGSSTMAFGIKSTAGGSGTATGTIPISANTWYQAVGTYDGAIVKNYVNGVLDNTTNYVATLRQTAVPLVTGYTSTSNLLYGSINYFMIYNRVLSNSEIAQLYCEPFCMFNRDPIELWTGAMGGGEPPVGNPGIINTWGGYWGATY